MIQRTTALLLCTIFVSFATSAFADVRLPGFFGDHMVLQQEKPIRIWGWADAGEQVTVSFGDATVQATTGADGKWTTELPAIKASKEPRELIVKGNNDLRLKDVLVGEVWLCGGQSNMEWNVQRSLNAKDEIAAANYPLIRHMKVARRQSTVPLDDIDSEWQICSPQTVANFTACGYFMARHLLTELDVPIGLVNSSWGGTRVEPWTPPVGFESVPSQRATYDSVMLRTPGTEKYNSVLGKYVRDTEAWLKASRSALAQGDQIEVAPTFPTSIAPYKNRQDPTQLYNGMIHGLVGYTIRGAIWYQGEANRADGMAYLDKKKALIGGWRKLWGQGDFPFYYVQIAPFKYGNDSPSMLPRLWEAQAAVETVPNTAMVVTNDIATLDNIHPPNKQDVGKRLALLALKNLYGRDVVARSPGLDEFKVLPGNIKLSFKNTAGGLKTRDGKTPSHFEIIGVGSGGFHPADAKITGNDLILTSPKVTEPVAFRFAWNKTATPNLMGGTGLPVAAFRGGKEPDLLDQLQLKDYQLVYELDLTNLSDKIQYSVDRSKDVSAYSRIGYLVELDRGGNRRSVFVAMDAFTKDITKIGLPGASTNANFQQSVQSMDVYSTVDQVDGGKGLVGNIEFWPNNYSPSNSAKVKNASGSQYDFGDQPASPRSGYGSMQVHHTAAKKTIFAINNWKAKRDADVGIGNNPSGHPDWTFTGSAKSYQSARLRVYVK